jgi:hypothetical protein
LLPLGREMPEKCFLRWRRQYGDCFTIWLGELPVVCVCDFRLIMETFQKDGDTYAGRYTFEELQHIIKGGILNFFKV